MVKYTEIIYWEQPTNCFTVFGHFVGLPPKGLKNHSLLFSYWVFSTNKKLLETSVMQASRLAWVISFFVSLQNKFFKTVWFFFPEFFRRMVLLNFRQSVGDHRQKNLDWTVKIRKLIFERQTNKKLKTAWKTMTWCSARGKGLGHVQTAQT